MTEQDKVNSRLEDLLCNYELLIGRVRNKVSDIEQCAVNLEEFREPVEVGMDKEPTPDGILEKFRSLNRDLEGIDTWLDLISSKLKGFVGCK